MDKAYEITSGTARFYNTFKDQVREELSKINQDRDLSPEGQWKRTGEVKAKRGVEMIQKAHTRKQEYIANLEKARKGADAIVFAAIKKPDATKLERFEAEFRSLKTELLFTANQEYACRKLSDFVRKIDDAYLASIVRDQFAELTANILPSGSSTATIAMDNPAGGEKVQRPIKSTLADMYRSLKDDFESQDVRDARAIMESASAQIANPKLFIDLVTQNATDLLGREYAMYINDTETYFDKHSEHKPADFVDPEKQEVKKQDDDGLGAARKAWREAEIARSSHLETLAAEATKRLEDHLAKQNEGAAV